MVLTFFGTSQRGYFQFSKGKKNRAKIDVLVEFSGVHDLDPAFRMIEGHQAAARRFEKTIHF